MSNTAQATSYDDVLYTGYAYDQTHVNRLATLGTLYGMEVTPVTSCRVLELGCGDGANLIPMALGLPGSQFHGIDLAALPVEHGQSIIADIGLENITLQQLSVMDIGADFGKFDYIIAHGLYSWIPSSAQDKILEICETNLAPHGIAYISYNAYPGSHLRQMLREMMMFHTRGITDTKERVTQARAVIQFLSKAQMEKTSQPELDAYRTFMGVYLEKILSKQDEFIFHDDLAEINEPLYFHQFVDRAATHGLQFLAEADFFDMQDVTFPPDVRQTLQHLGDQSTVLREQYMDFLRCRMFRQTLLCRSDLRLDRTLNPRRLRSLAIASPIRPVAPEPDVKSSAEESFRGIKSAEMSTNDPVAKAALVELGKVYPQAVPFDELLGRARALSERDKGNVSDEDTERDARVLSEIMMAMYAGNFVELWSHMPHFVIEASERPVASSLVRWQASHQTVVTNLRHVGVKLKEPIGLRMLTLLDGTRDRVALVEELSDFVANGNASIPGADGVPVQDRAQARSLIAKGLDSKLDELARLALFIA